MSKMKNTVVVSTSSSGARGATCPTAEMIQSYADAFDYKAGMISMALICGFSTCGVNLMSS